jgi:hypothetical protein
MASTRMNTLVAGGLAAVWLRPASGCASRRCRRRRRPASGRGDASPPCRAQLKTLTLKPLPPALGDKMLQVILVHLLDLLDRGRVRVLAPLRRPPQRLVDVRDQRLRRSDVTVRRSIDEMPHSAVDLLGLRDESFGHDRPCAEPPQLEDLGPRHRTRRRNLLDRGTRRAHSGDVRLGPAATQWPEAPAHISVPKGSLAPVRSRALTA